MPSCRRERVPGADVEERWMLYVKQIIFAMVHRTPVPELPWSLEKKWWFKKRVDDLLPLVLLVALPIDGGWWMSKMRAKQSMSYDCEMVFVSFLLRWLCNNTWKMRFCNFIHNFTFLPRLQVKLRIKKIRDGLSIFFCYLSTLSIIASVGMVVISNKVST